MENVLKDVACNTLCLQYTKWENETPGRVKDFWRGPILASHGSSLGNEKRIDLKHKLIHINTNGRYIFISLKLSRSVCKSMTIYAPNNEDKRKRITFSKFINGPTIIVGDLNVVLTENDVSSNNTFKAPAGNNYIKQ